MVRVGHRLHPTSMTYPMRTALQHHGARLEGVHDALHDGLEQAVEGGVVRPIPQRHIHAVVLAVLLRVAWSVSSDKSTRSAAVANLWSQQHTALAIQCLSFSLAGTDRVSTRHANHRLPTATPTVPTTRGPGPHLAHVLQVAGAREEKVPELVEADRQHPAVFKACQH
jgi:hypothetical protein